MRLAILRTVPLALTLLACGSYGAADALPVANDGIDPPPMGPTIACSSPNDGAMLKAAAGSSIPFGGTVTSPNGVATVTVNGAAATLADTKFSASVTTRFGINFADVVATDGHGAQSTRTCAFLISDQWAAEDKPFADTIDLKLTQSAVDAGGNHIGSPRSIADVLTAVASSPGLRDGIGGGVVAMNPIKPQTCDQGTCTPFGCACLYSTGIDVRGVSLPGPQNVTLALVDGGLTVGVNVPSVGVFLDVHGAVGPVPYGIAGWAVGSNVNVSMTFDITASGGRLHATLRGGSTSAAVGSVSTAFPGLDGWIVNNVAVPFAQGLIVNGVSSALASDISNTIGSTLDGALAGLDASKLGSPTFVVPSIANSGPPVSLSIGLGISSLSTTPSGMRIGISSQLGSTATHALPSLGVPIPNGTMLDDTALNTPSNVGVAVHVGVLNQVLHALWRGGLFDTTLTGAGIGADALPAGGSVKLTTRLPPVAELKGSSVELSLGAMDLEVTHPSFSTLAVELGARVTVSPTIKDSMFRYENVELSELHFSTETPLAPTSHQVLTSTLQKLVKLLVVQSLNNTAPAMPLHPSFALPSSLQTYGVSGSLGVSNLSLGNAKNHFVLFSQLGGQ